jgi:ribosomal protein S18 acetylase RimI-like enzyme
LPDARQFLTYFRPVLEGMCGPAFSGRSAFVAGDFQGAALWLRPGAEPDGDRLGALMQEAIPESQQEARFGFFEQMATYHPHEPLWYLPMIGVDPAYQGGGLGSALLAHALAEVDRGHSAAYLEATTPRSRDLYARHGFEVTGTIQVADSPPMFPMLRKPR